MPVLEINACVDCPHHRINNYAIEGVSTSEDLFAIRCEHPDQKSEEYFAAKIKHCTYSIYFDCPLNKNEEDNWNL